MSDELEIEDEQVSPAAPRRSGTPLTPPPAPPPPQVVFGSVMRWVRYDPEARRHHLPELLRGVRLALLPSEFLLKVVAGEELVMADRRSRYAGEGGGGGVRGADGRVLRRSAVEEAVQCKKILQNDGVVTSACARPRKAGHTLLILGGQTFMCDKIYQVNAHATAAAIATDSAFNPGVCVVGGGVPSLPRWTTRPRRSSGRRTCPAPARSSAPAPSAARST